MVADSDQLSIALTEPWDDDYRGTALASQTGIEFLLTIPLIRFLPVMAGSVGFGDRHSLCCPSDRSSGPPPCRGFGHCPRRQPWLWSAVDYAMGRIPPTEAKKCFKAFSMPCIRS